MGNKLTPQAWIELINPTLGKISNFAFSAAREEIEALEIPPNWFFLWIAYELEPKNANAEGNAIQNPYGSSAGVLKQFKVLADSGYLEAVGDEEYKLSDFGRKKFLGATSALNKQIDAMHLLSIEERAQLEKWLGALVHKAVNDPPFEHNGAVKRNHRSYIPDSSDAVKIFQYITDLNAYRDDCHMSTWRWTHDVDGPTWEAFSFLWQDADMNTPEKISERLKNRGHDVTVYKSAYVQLEKLGWISRNDDGTYAITDKGTEIREAAEALTDEYYAQTFAILGEDEQAAFDLLSKFQTELNELHSVQKRANVYKTVNESFAAVRPFYGGVSGQIFVEFDATGANWADLFDAQGADPKPLTAELMQKLQPFTSISRYESRLNDSTEKGFLAKADNGYLMTDKGRELITKFFVESVASLNDYEPLPLDEMDTLVNYFRQIVEATTASDVAEPKLNFAYSRNTDAGNLTGLAALDQYLTDLQRYRDDAHNAVWRELGVSAIEWEALSHVWSGEGNNAETLHEKRPYRHYDVADYGKAFESITERGWLHEENGEYSLTDEGKHVRDVAEQTTDAYFYVGWQDLSDDDLTTINELSDKLYASLRALANKMGWELGRQTMSDFMPFYQPVTGPLMQEIGFEGPDWFFTMLALGVDPQPLTQEVWASVSPYGNTSTFEDMVSGSVERGYLQAVDDGYRLTDVGRDGITQFFSKAGSLLQEADLLAEDQMNKLANLLAQMVADIQQMEFEKPFFNISRVTEPGDDANPAVRIDQYLTDMARLRDDAHVAAWKPSGLKGYEFEMFSFIWNGEATTADAMMEQRGNRRFEASDYQQAIETLVERGLVKADGEAYVVTEEGNTLREEIETKTDEYFYAAWDNLSNFDHYQVIRLLELLDNKLKAVAPEPQQA